MRNSLAAPRIKPSSPPIDVPLSELIGLSKATRLLPRHDDGTPRSFHFVLRYVKSGRLPHCPHRALLDDTSDLVGQRVRPT